MKLRPIERRALEMRPIERCALQLCPFERRALQICPFERRAFEMRFIQVHFAKFRAIKNRAFEPAAMKVECVVFPIELFGIIDLERLLNVETLQTWEFD